MPLRSGLLSVLTAIILIIFSCNRKTDSAAETSKTPADSVTVAEKTILFFGNSLTAGYGLEPQEAFSALIQAKIDSAGLKYRTVNAGLSGETTAGGVERVDWVLKQKVDIFVLELGANDGLRGIPPDITLKNLKKIIAKVRTQNPETKILLAGMESPPNMGAEYVSKFRNTFTQISTEEKTELIPFLLENVAGKKELNLADGIHPNANGQKIVAQTVWKHLQPML